MAMIIHSAVSKTDWQGVADELGVEKIGTVQQRWYRFKAAKFGSTQGSPKFATATTPKKKGGAAGKKRGIDEMNDGDDEAGRRVPVKKIKEKMINLKSPGSDEDGEEDGELDAEKSGDEMEKGVSKDKGGADDDATDGSALEA